MVLPKTTIVPHRANMKSVFQIMFVADDSGGSDASDWSDCCDSNDELSSSAVLMKKLIGQFNDQGTSSL